MYNDIAHENMNLISQIEEQIKKKNKSCINDDHLHRCFWIEFATYIKQYNKLYYRV